MGLILRAFISLSRLEKEDCWRLAIGARRTLRFSHWARKHLVVDAMSAGQVVNLGGGSLRRCFMEVKLVCSEVYSLPQIGYTTLYPRLTPANLW